MKILYYLLFAALVAVLASGCAPYFSQPLAPQSARLGPETPMYNELTSLPAPENKLYVAVYKFRDQTGQYKPSDLGTNWSTAVTQGATTILTRSLEQTDWFIPVERENVGNLLNERKIIRASKAQFSPTEEAALLPPLLYATLLLEGGIISYESNIRTGGVGARYFGIGGSTQYREDRVTVYLRAVATSNGKVLKTVYTTKTILSQAVDVGVFRFVKPNAILEAETGFTYNEPSEMAVTEAIEKAVQALILEGEEEGLWNFKNPADTSLPVVQNFYAEREGRFNIDQFGKELSDDWRGVIGLGFNGGGWLYSGDYPNAEVQPFWEFSANVHFNPRWFLTMNIGRGRLGAAEGFDAGFNNTDLLVNYRFMPEYRLTPFVFGGVSVLTEATQFPSFAEQYNTVHWQTGLGFEYMAIPNLGLNLAGFNNFAFRDDLDGVVQGKYNDYNWGLKFGVKYYLGDFIRNGGNGNRNQNANTTDPMQLLNE